MTLFGLFYDLSLHLYALTSLPKILTHFGKYKGNFLQRLGFGFPQIEKQNRKLIWIHAVSLGETKAVQPLIKQLKEHDPSLLILLSTATQTGHTEGIKNAKAADFHVFLPFDFSYIIRPIMKRVAPDVVILIETDFWFNFQDAAKKVGALVVLINGKISERSFARLCQLPFLSKRLFNPIDHFYLQSEIYKKRFAELKIPPSKLTVTGNLKLDSTFERCDERALKTKLGLTDETVLTLGSTHDPEESLWIATLKRLWTQFPELKTLIVPRHPERFDQVAKLLAAEQISFSRWSEQGTFQKTSVMLVDAMGVLRQCYQISDLTFVGGSFAKKVGGHNILEPAYYGKPVIFGPYMHSQPDFLDLIIKHNAGIQLTQETLFSTTQNLLLNHSLSSQLGSNGQKLFSSARGALNHTFNALLPLLQNRHI